MRSRVDVLGNIDVILISGDIANKGAAPEYIEAREWIKDLARVARCPLERVYVVPGNHDVDRNVARNNSLVRGAQKLIADATLPEREYELKQILEQEASGLALLEPLHNYNEFASHFNCQVYAPERLFWTQTLPIENGVQLRIYGLTSTVLSGRPGIEDSRNSLYLSPLQTVLDPEDDIVNLVLCHHPPDWFSDHAEADECITSRAAIQLFGHTHRQRLLREDGYIRFSAGAVNPARNELGFQPGYNLIDLRVVGKGDERKLDIKAYLLHWQSNPEMFRLAETKPPHSKNYFPHQIAIPGYEGNAHVDAAIPACSPEVPPAAGELVPAESEADIEVSMSEPHTRNLIYRFWELDVDERLAIAKKLGLLTDADNDLAEPAKYGRALRRAAENNQLAELAEEIERKENK